MTQKMIKNNFLGIFCKKKNKNVFPRQKNDYFLNFFMCGGLFFLKKMFFDKKIYLPEIEHNSASLYIKAIRCIHFILRYAKETISIILILVKKPQNTGIGIYDCFSKI